MWGKGKSVKSLSKHTCFEAIVRPHITSLYQLAYRFCGNQADAEDLIQDLLLKLYPKCEELEKIENKKSWMSRVLYHLYIDKIRQNSRRPDIVHDLDPDTVSDSVHIDNTTPEAELNNSLIQKEINHAMQSLNADQKALVVLHDMEEYTLPELSKMLDTPIGTLKSRLHRARASLRETLQKRTHKMEPISEFKRVIK
jgi:RNA polymerase sigma-70 factor (ECF subfamily)